MALTAYINSDNVIALSGLKDTIADTFINTASVYVKLLDPAGDEVVGETWPLLMNYISGSDGIYRATLADSLTISEGRYQAIITADDGAGQYRTFYIDIDYQYG